MTQSYYDLCSALEIDPCHKEALRMKTDCEEKAVNCKNQVHCSRYVYFKYSSCGYSYYTANVVLLLFICRPFITVWLGGRKML